VFDISFLNKERSAKHTYLFLFNIFTKFRLKLIRYLTNTFPTIYDKFMNIKRGIHHVRHTRPQWYKDYHQWEHHSTLHWATFVVSSLVILMGFVNVISQYSQNPFKRANAATDSTILTQEVTAGALTISNSGDESLSSASVSTSNQNTTGSLGTITVTDARGTGVGWSATATSTDFYKVNSAVQASGANNTVTTDATSTYSNSTGGTYTITIDTGGAVGVATFDVTGVETANDVSTGDGSEIAIGTRGVLVDFAAATYVTGDSWTVRVDTIPVTGIRVTPGSVTTISGASTNVTDGAQHTFTTTADATALITATEGYGLGSYSVAPALQVTVPANSYANTYTATVTETVL
jgi:hypothetical protein